jgi:hypothetical protein
MKSIAIVSLFAVLSMAACSAGVDATHDEEASVTSEEQAFSYEVGELATEVADFEQASSSPGGCRGPKPRTIGCRITCKPCKFPVCEDGVWTYETIEWSDEECRPHGPPGGGDPWGNCNVGPGGFCPAECHSCT